MICQYSAPRTHTHRDSKQTEIILYFLWTTYIYAALMLNFMMLLLFTSILCSMNVSRSARKMEIPVDAIKSADFSCFIQFQREYFLIKHVKCLEKNDSASKRSTYASEYFVTFFHKKTIVKTFRDVCTFIFVFWEKCRKSSTCECKIIQFYP